MQCPACHVDLNETARRCPLCGGPAQGHAPAIPGVAYQDYPRGRGRVKMSLGEKWKARLHM